MVPSANLEADTRINHILTAAHRSADRNHCVFIRAIVGSYSYSISTLIVTITCRKIPLAVRIEIKRMESCQSSSTGTDTIDSIIHIINSAANLVEGLIRLIQLTAVNGIR